MTSPKCKMLEGDLVAGKSKPANKASKRPFKDRSLLYDADPPMPPKKKCVETSDEEQKYPKPIYQARPMVNHNGSSIEIKFPEDKSIKYASHIKHKSTKYNNPIVPVLPLIFAQVKHV